VLNIPLNRKLFVCSCKQKKERKTVSGSNRSSSRIARVADKLPQLKDVHWEKSVNLEQYIPVHLCGKCAFPSMLLMCNNFIVISLNLYIYFLSIKQAWHRMDPTHTNPANKLGIFIIILCSNACHFILQSHAWKRETFAASHQVYWGA